MAGISNLRKKQSSSSSSSSSDNDDEDPDYTVRLPQRLSRQGTFISLSELERENQCEDKGFQNTACSSRIRGKSTRTAKKKDNKQGEMPMIKTPKMIESKNGPGLIKTERINFGRKRSSTSRRNREFQDEINQENNSRNHDEDGGNSASRNKNQENEDDKKEKKKRATIFSWLIDSKTIQEIDEVVYMDDYSKKIIKKGTIRREGILCNCCHKIFTAANFVFHGGRISHNRPYERIFTFENKLSLLSCMIKAWNRPEECERRKFSAIRAKGNASDSYDDACVICADGGKLMCCEECNSTYHQVCIGLEVVPRGSWYCPYCVCKFCGDPTHERDYLLECPQCEKRYHWECHLRRELKIIDLNSIPCAPFCEKGCKEIHDKLERSMVGMKNELDEGFSWSLLHRMDDDSRINLDDKYKRTVCHSKLAVALRLMEDSFETIVDRHTRINVIRSVVYNCGSNFNRIQFRGFYTAVLEKDEEIISVASLRIHGTKLAEMPFIATSHIYRCKGMCKKLMVAIESALCYLTVEKLVIPSTSERISSWTEKYGFHLLDWTMQKEIIRRNTLMFHDSIRLQKSLISSNVAKSGRSTGSTSLRKARTNHQQNWLSCTQKSAMASQFDLNLQPSEWNKNPWMLNRDRMPHSQKFRHHLA